MTPTDPLRDQESRLRAAIQDACAHGGPCQSCQIARVHAEAKAIDRERAATLRDLRDRLDEGVPLDELRVLARQAVEGLPRDTDLDTALTLLARVHTVLRRAKTPRPDPDFVREITDYLAQHGIEVGDV